LLIGAGGHAKVLYDALLSLGLTGNIQIYDDNHLLDGQPFFEHMIKAPIGDLESVPSLVHVAIGHNRDRLSWCATLRAASKILQTVQHPNAAVARSATIGDGSFAAAGSVIGPDAKLGLACIVNHGAVVDHECLLGDAVHVAPNATLGGGVRVGDGTLIGAGAVVLPLIEIGAWASIGAGAVVTKDVAVGAIVVGVPARVRQAND
jgi:sugar O-acyltransferase (sialic acid O-acetyltransferase NeuD family)